MVLIPAGKFWIGNPSKEPFDGTSCYEVEITKDFYVGKYSVTQALWEVVMHFNQSSNRGVNRPIENISWFECIEFCNRLSQMNKREPVYTTVEGRVICNWEANGYRLLTEAEWEYVAKRGALISSDGKRTVNIVEAEILQDMLDGVLEFCWDSDDKQNLSQELVKDPRRSAGYYRVCRGKAKGRREDPLFSTPFAFDPNFRFGMVGLRVGYSN